MKFDRSRRCAMRFGLAATILLSAIDFTEARAQQNTVTDAGSSGRDDGSAVSNLKPLANNPDVSSSDLNIVDARPNDEKKTKKALTGWRYSCEFGIQELGDEYGNHIDQLRDDIFKAFGNRLLPAAVVVNHYHLYLNQRAFEARAMLTTGIAGQPIPAGPLIASTFGRDGRTVAPACTRDKMPKGWFDPAEVTTPFSPLIVELDVHIDGREYQVHSVYSPLEDMPAPTFLNDFKNKEERAAARAALEKADAALIAEVRGQLGTVPDEGVTAATR